MRAMVFAILFVVCAPAIAVRAEARPASAQSAADAFAGSIAEAARRFGVPATWIRAVMRAESNGDRRAVSPKGAMGLMQIMPETWDALRVRYRLGRDPFDPHDNILAGAAFLREMHDRYGSPGFLAAYNAGPGRYEEYRDRHRPLPPETIAYVAKLLPLVAGNDGEMPIQAATFDPPAWTRALIFIARSVSAPLTDQASSQAPSDNTPTVTAVRDVSAIAPRSDGLFAAISATERKP